MQAKIDALVHLFPPIPRLNVRRVKDDLTYKGFDFIEQEDFVVKDFRAYRNTSIRVPRAYGTRLLGRLGIKAEDATVKGTRIGRLRPVELRDYQVEPVSEMVRLSKTLKDFRIKAHTGSGKTVMSCEFARRRGVTTTILVDQEFLMNQWIETLTDLFGCPRDRIGIVRGKKHEIKGKWFVVAMVQTLYRQGAGDLADFAGTLIIDESHVVGAEVFSQVLWQFPSAVRVGVSATPERGDVYDKVLTNHLGRVEYELQKEHRRSEVRYIETDFIPSWYSSISPKTGRYLSELSESGKRNEMIAASIQWLYESGRNVLGMSERIEQLEHMKSLCIALGIPEGDIGIVAGYEYSYGYTKNTRPSRRPRGWEKETEYTPVKLDFVKKRIPKKVLEERKNTKRIILATYGMFSKGVDVPRLDSGIDLTPRSKVEQVHGRILRDKGDKMMPIWVTVRDKLSFRAEYQFSLRLKDYEKSNAEVFLWKQGKGVKRKDVKALRKELAERIEALKKYRIETRDGRNVLVTGKVSNRQGSGQGSTTAEGTPRGRVRSRRAS